jgi:hypothetical protein
MSQDSRWQAYDGGGTWGGSRMLNLRRRDFVSLLGGRVAACFASPLTEERRDAGFELSVTRSHDGG